MIEPQTVTAPKTQKRMRSPSFPFISLPKALERAKAMEERHKQFATSAEALSGTWDLTPTSSSFLQTISALKAFGLIEDEGAGKDRRIKISDLARRILLDTRTGVRETALREAAKKPALLREFLGHWGANRPSDDHCVSELQLDHKFTQDAAANFLKVFDETFRYAGAGPSDKLPDSDDGTNQGSKEGDVPPPPAINVGDRVQWESLGQIQFPTPRRVTKVEHDAKHGWFVSVEGYAGALPMQQVSRVTDPPTAAATSAQPTPTDAPTKSKDQCPVFIERATMPLPEGVAAMEFPSSMSQASYDDLVAWIEVMKNRAKRSVN